MNTDPAFRNIHFIATVTDEPTCGDRTGSVTTNPDNAGCIRCAPAPVAAPNEYIVHHTGGEFLVRTRLEINAAADQIAERWNLDIEDIDYPTNEDIAINQGQWTELDTTV